MSMFVLRIVVHCTTYLCLPPSVSSSAQLEQATEANSTNSTLERDRGQATTEYALVMLGAAAIAVLVIAWATAGGGAGKIGRLFDRVIDAVLDKI